MKRPAVIAAILIIALAQALFPGDAPAVNQFIGADPARGIPRGTVITPEYLNSLGLPPTITAPVRSVTSSGLVDKDGDYILLVDATSGQVDLSLPSVLDMASGRRFVIKKTDPSANAVVVTTTGSETINGGSTLALAKQNDTSILINDGTGYQTELISSQFLEYEVDALNDYGGGTSYTRVTVDTALAAIGTSSGATLLLRPGTWVIDAPADWSAYTNVTFKFAPGCVLSGAFPITFPPGTVVPSAAFANLAEAVVLLGSSDVTLDLNTSETISADLTIPATVSIHRNKGRLVTVASGKTLTIAGPVSKGDFQTFTGDGAVEFLKYHEISAAMFLSSGQPTGTANNSAEVQKAINSLLTKGGKITLPQAANRYRLNVTCPANVVLEGSAPHATLVGPYNNADPVVAVTGSRAKIRHLYFYGDGVGTSTVAVRHDRALDGAGGGLIIEDNRFSWFTTHIDIRNNYYNEIRNNTFANMTYGIYGRNAFNRTLIMGNKFSAFDYGIALFYDPAVDTYVSHAVTLFDNSYETPNAGGIAEYFFNSGGHVSDHEYYEGFYSASAWPILEAGGPVYAWHTGSSDSTYFVDRSGRDFVKLGVSVGDTIYNRTDGSSGTITGIANESATNDRINVTLSGGDSDFDVDDYIIVDVDTTTEYRGGINVRDPHCSSQGDADQLLEGVNRIVSDIQGSWSGTESGNLKYNKLSSYGYTASERLDLDFSSNLSEYARIALGKVRISYTFVNTSGSSGYLTFRPVGGGVNDTHHYHDFAAAGTISQTVDVPLDPDGRVQFVASRAGTLSIRLHGVLKQ